MNPSQARDLLARSWEQSGPDGFTVAMNIRRGVSQHQGPATAAIMEAHRIGIREGARFNMARQFKRGRRRGLAIGFLATYLLGGAIIGLNLKDAVPATNYAGAAYLAVIWPVWMAQPLTGWEPPVPSWCFTFREGK